MSQYQILITEEAKHDILQLADVIKYQYKSPLTAFNYVQGLIDEIKKLEVSAELTLYKPEKHF